LRDALPNGGRRLRTEVAAVGLCGHNDGVYPVDAAGEPVRAAILATDSRARDYVARYRADGTADKALPVTGQSPFAGSPASIYAWLRRDFPAPRPNPVVKPVRTWAPWGWWG
jgi:sugar (pentulose or hexulose) kinase